MRNKLSSVSSDANCNCCPIKQYNGGGTLSNTGGWDPIKQYNVGIGTGASNPQKLLDHGETQSSGGEKIGKHDLGDFWQFVGNSFQL